MVAAVHGGQPLLQPQDLRPFGELVASCEIQEMAFHIATAVMQVFQAIAQFIIESCSQLKNWVFDLLPSSDDQVGPPGSLAAIAAGLGVPAQEREDVIARAQPLIVEGMNSWSKREILAAVGAVPAAEREAFVAHARPLIAARMGWWSIKRILDAVVAIPAQHRGDVIANARPLFTERMDGEEMGTVIEAIHAIADDDREAVIALANPLITDRMTGGDRNAILAAVAAVPIEDRADVTMHAQALITEGNGDQFSEQIIRAIAAIPEEQRGNVIEHAQGLITPEMIGHDRREIIAEIGAVPENERANFVIEWRNRPRPGNVDFAQGMNVHAGNRDALTLAAIGLLCQHQGAIPEPQINQAVQAFRDYLDASRAFTVDRKRLARASLNALDRGRFQLQDGTRVTGHQLIGRVWIFASQLNEPDATNAKDGMIAALEDGHGFCDIGQAQRVVVAVLQGQGRLAGVNIEGNLVPPRVAREDAMNMFFTVPERRRIDTLAPLLAAANQFCNENPGVNREDFLEDINLYAARGEIV